MLPELIVAPRKHARNHKRQDSNRGRELPLLRLTISSLDAKTLGGSDRVQQLLIYVLVDQVDVGDFTGWQEAQEVVSESAGPDGGRDCLADGSADGGEHVLDGEDDGDVLVGCGGHDGDLLGDDLGCECQRFFLAEI